MSIKLPIKQINTKLLNAPTNAPSERSTFAKTIVLCKMWCDNLFNKNINRESNKSITIKLTVQKINIDSARAQISASVIFTVSLTLSGVIFKRPFNNPRINLGTLLSENALLTIASISSLGNPDKFTLKLLERPANLFTIFSNICSPSFVLFKSSFPSGLQMAYESIKLIVPVNNLVKDFIKPRQVPIMIPIIKIPITIKSK